jgi:hypothetical protein
MDGRNPTLARLDVLVGRWTVQPKVEGVGPAWTEFAWQEGGLFLRQYSDVDPNAPGFNQRFTGTLSADADTIDGRWEMSKDGVTWNLDFELAYHRQR